MGSGYLRKVVVLLVEDCEEVFALYANALERAGMTVRGAPTIAAAREALATDALPDLVVMDRELPDGDGFALARRLKGDPRTSDVPIIGFTATHPVDAMRAAHAAGLDGFVAKPCPTDKLVSLALILLGTASRASAC